MDLPSIQTVKNNHLLAFLLCVYNFLALNLLIIPDSLRKRCTLRDVMYTCSCYSSDRVLTLTPQPHWVVISTEHDTLHYLLLHTFSLLRCPSLFLTTSYQNPIQPSNPSSDCISCLNPSPKMPLPGSSLRKLLPLITMLAFFLWGPLHN